MKTSYAIAKLLFAILILPVAAFLVIANMVARGAEEVNSILKGYRKLFLEDGP